MITPRPTSHRKRSLAAPLRTGLALSLAILAGCPFDSDEDSGRGGDGTPVQSTFSKSYGGPQDDTATAVVASADGGFLLVGQADATEQLAPNGSGGIRGDLWINKLDADGNIETQRLLGAQPAIAAGSTTFVRARPTPDGGVLLVGYDYPTSGNALRERTNIAVTRLDAQGNALWARTHDSGPWLNYAYFETSDAAAAASDTGSDVWPLPDGGYLVAGVSRANLEDRFGLGFPCPLVGDNDDDGDDEDPCQSFPPGAPGQRFHDAISVVVMRVSAAGEVRWIRRFTEEAFRLETAELGDSGSRPDPIVRATHDGGALVARTLRNKTLFHRLLPDGSPLPLTVVDQQLNLSHAEQTDDPDSNGVRDGVRNDGFIISAKYISGSQVIKLAADGEVDWNLQVGSTDFLSPGPYVNLFGVHQRCNAGGASCLFAAVGTYKEYDDRDHSALVVFIDEDGDTLRSVVGPLLWTIDRIQGGEDGAAYRMLARNDRGEQFYAQLTSDGSELRDDGPAPGFSPQVDPSRRDRMPGGELTPDGNMVLFDGYEEQRLMYVDERGSMVNDIALRSAGHAGETALAAVEIAPGRYVVAAQVAHPSDFDFALSTGWLLRYDVRTTGDTLVWQRSLESEGRIGRIEGLAASGDGGFVAAVRHDQSLRLIKFDADARLIWQTPRIATAQTNGRYTWRELHATADGGFVALAVHPGGTSSFLVSVDGGGSIRAQREYAIGLTSVTATADGGFALAASPANPGAILRVVKVDASGVPQWARRYGPGGRFELAAGSPRIRRTAGGFVVGITEKGLFTAREGDDEVPLGEKNVFLLALDEGGSVRWSRVYGALQNETLRDLVVRADGVILAAGSSGSLGENSEAWLLKLGPDGLIAAGCNAHLGDIAPQLIEVEDIPVENRAFDVLNAPDDTVDMGVPALPLRAATQIVTARQCSGTVNPGTEPPPRFRLSIIQAGDRRGVLTSTPTGIACGTGLGDEFCAADFASGTRVVLRADIEGFVRWLQDCEEGTGGTDLQCVVTVDRNRTVQVQFGELPAGPRELTVLRAGTGSGRVTGQGITCPEDCTESYAHGTLVALQAIPDDGSSFQGWASGCDSIDADTCLVTMNSPRTVTGVFQLISGQQFALEVARNGEGDGTVTGPGIACGADCDEVYDEGASVTLTATERQGSTFAGWFGCQQVNLNQCTVAMSQSRQIAATFDLNPNFANVSVVRAGDGAQAGRVVSDFPGIDCGDACSARFLIGSQLVLTPAAGSATLQGWQGCDSVVGNECRLTINGPRNITASFDDAGFFTLTVQKSGTGSGNVTSQPVGINCGNDCAQSYASGTRVGLFPQPDANSLIIGWTGCDSVADNICEVEVTSPRTVTARFDQRPN